MIDTCYHTQPHSASHGFWDSNSNANSCTASIRPSFMCLSPTLAQKDPKLRVVGKAGLGSPDHRTQTSYLSPHCFPSNGATTTGPTICGYGGLEETKDGSQREVPGALRRPCCYYHPSFSPADRTLGRISRGQTQKFLELLPNRVTQASVGSGYSEKPHLVQVGKPGMKPGSGL